MLLNHPSWIAGVDLERACLPGDYTYRDGNRAALRGGAELSGREKLVVDFASTPGGLAALTHSGAFRASPDAPQTFTPLALPRVEEPERRESLFRLIFEMHNGGTWGRRGGRRWTLWSSRRDFSPPPGIACSGFFDRFAPRLHRPAGEGKSAKQTTRSRSVS